MSNSLAASSSKMPNGNYELIWRAKGLADGASTPLEIAIQLEKMANTLRQMHADGVQLIESVDDDYAFLKSSTPSIAAKYGMHKLTA